MTAGHDTFPGGGHAGAIMRELDWTRTPLGGVERWPQSLRAAVGTVLASRYPMLLLWGEDFTQLYNDAYSALIGDGHPAAMGGDVRVTLAAGWDVLGPIIEEAMTTGVASWLPALQLLLERSGYREESYFSVSHGPARDDSGQVVGVLTVCSEVTDQVVGERRFRLLRDLALQAGQTTGVERTCTALLDVLSGHPLDVPFAAIYLREGDDLRRVAAFGTDVRGLPVALCLPELAIPRDAPDPWGLRRAAEGTSGDVVKVAELVTVVGGPWEDHVETALALPLPGADAAQPLGVLLVGTSPNRALDDGYRSFVGLLVQQASMALRNAHAYQDERRRAEALAELDRVKTDFFTNVSHEFRTPLTLMLGPLDDALVDQAEPLTGIQRERVDTARRSSGRLLRLVNNLLTFASLGAGRAQAESRPVDLALATADVASTFRAAVERAGLRFDVHTPDLPGPVSLDPGAWEKVVANLLSNALKFTFVGRIAVDLRADDDAVRLVVADTGIGIAAADIGRLFERFHRVRGARSRSHEGSGIGLALVKELVVLQGGEVEVDSTVGEGTTFTVVLPWAALHPRTDHRAGSSPDVGEVGRAAAEEAEQWLTTPLADPPEPSTGTPGARVVVADDNNDMRAYLTRLLQAQGWDVEAVADGEAALAAVRRSLPDLVLTDVMMPVLDGFELVRALRDDPATMAVPVVVLSARAGREASVEGLDLGADDYVVKPFVATELIARLRTTMALAQVRGSAGPDAAAAPQRPSEDRSEAVGRGPASPVDRAADPARLDAAGVDVTGLDSTGLDVDAGRATAVGAAAHLALGDTWTDYDSRAETVRSVRRDLDRALQDAGVDEDVASDLVLATSEAVSNAVEHAHAPTGARIQVRVVVTADAVEVVVRDFGRWQERGPSMDRGRGASLMGAVADVRVTPGDDGTTVSIRRRLHDGS